MISKKLLNEIVASNGDKWPDDEVIFKEIIVRAEKKWPYDKETQAQWIEEEKEAYKEVRNLDYGGLESEKGSLLKLAENCRDWSGLLYVLSDEICSYQYIKDFTVEGMDQETIDRWKVYAKTHKQYDRYSDERYLLMALKSGASELLSDRRRMQKMRKLFTELELIIARSCSYGGRYPISFRGTTQKKYSKNFSISDDIPHEDLVTGYYKFGIHELDIGYALENVIEHLKKNYNLKI